MKLKQDIKQEAFCAVDRLISALRVAHEQAPKLTEKTAWQVEIVELERLRRAIASCEICERRPAAGRRR